jgi:pimeloyl-ACP methyl ester carboxylesterase
MLRLAVLLALGLSACVSSRDSQEDGAESYTEVRRGLLEYRPDFDEFLSAGPLKVKERLNVPLRIPPGDRVIADELIPVSDSKMPLVIIVHGNHSRKEAHRYQARRLASFGLHTLVLQLDNTDNWLKNGQLVARLAHRLHNAPGLLRGNFDPESIVLVGHSFGGSAVAIAAARGAPVKGLVLLDPAVVSERRVTAALTRIRQPVMLLGADKEVFRSRQRRLFYRTAHGEMAEVSVRGATHDDAQYPSMFALSTFGVDPFTSRAKQEIFTAALTASAFSIAATGSLDFAWSSFGKLVDRGVLKNPKRRSAKAVGDPERTSH